MNDLKGFLLYFDKLKTIREILNPEELNRLLGITLDYAKTGDIPSFIENDRLLKVAWDIMLEMITASYNNLMASSIEGRYKAHKKYNKKDKRSLAEWYVEEPDFNPDYIKNPEEKKRAYALSERKQPFIHVHPCATMCNHVDAYKDTITLDNRENIPENIEIVEKQERVSLPFDLPF